MLRFALLPALACLSLLAPGCGIRDPYADGDSTAPASSTTTRTAAAAAATGSTAEANSAGSPDGAPAAARDEAVHAFVAAWTTWTAETLPAQRRKLIALAAEPLAAQLRRDATEATRNQLEQVIHASSRGRLVGVLPDAGGTFIVVTTESAKSDEETDGQAAYHVYRAAGQETDEGWRLTRWEPTA